MNAEITTLVARAYERVRHLSECIDECAADYCGAAIGKCAICLSDGVSAALIAELAEALAARPAAPPVGEATIEMLRHINRNNWAEVERLRALIAERPCAGSQNCGMDDCAALASPAPQPAEPHEIDLPEQGTREDYRRVTKYWRDRAIAAEAAAAPAPVEPPPHDWRPDGAPYLYRCNRCLVASTAPHGPTCPAPKPPGPRSGGGILSRAEKKP